MMEMVNTGPEACSLLRILPCLQYLSSMACPVVLFQHSRSSLQKRHKIIIPSVACPIFHDRRSWLYSCLQWSYCLWQLSSIWDHSEYMKLRASPLVPSMWPCTGNLGCGAVVTSIVGSTGRLLWPWKNVHLPGSSKYNQIVFIECSLLLIG
jgi:hypothetical protein